MISSLTGTVAYVAVEYAIIEVGGVGLQVSSNASTLRDLRVGNSATLHTNLVVREDSLTLFGFANASDRDAFGILQSVSGVGPRTALAALSVFTADQLRLAVATGDETALTKVPGIGKKGAARLVLELADKLGPATSAATASAPVSIDVRGGWQERVTMALTELGWTSREAAAAVEATSAEHGTAIPEDRTEEQHVSVMLAASLRGMSRR